MSIQHMMMMRWKADVTVDEDALVDALHAMAAQLEGCESYVCGPDAGLAPAAYDFGIVGTFVDKAAWESYMSHPEHKRVGAEMIVPVMAEGAMAQFEF